MIYINNFQPIVQPTSAERLSASEPQSLRASEPKVAGGKVTRRRADSLEAHSRVTSGAAHTRFSPSTTPALSAANNHAELRGRGGG